ncbi:30S ribosomal protein S6e [Candidatus Micrarchaeota archaeon]|nr:30S ribosomal protein S6e [Candidatus Micrarchaeota archaeon]MBU1166721.1 30S ribosomal protein S6e [Candidatus Micrarchaeota archaeon]MBU1886640.1 30S ribosomal protein S6e [Candidatus Micrarchaeota archaeon]
MRIVISEPASGKSYQVELPKDKEALIVGKRMGEELDGNLVGAAGYMLELTGGSDTSGFPMKVEVHGSSKKSILMTKGVGFNTKRKGERRRKHIRGNTYSSEIMQVNVKVKQAGPTPLDQLFPKVEKTESK